jgi:hypothetical protein
VEHGDCTVCGKNVHDGPTTLRDFYELTHTYYELNEQGSIDIVSPETVATLTFCSAQCLCVHVAAKILPDAHGEGHSSQ